MPLFQTDFGRLWLIIGLVMVFGVIPIICNSPALKVLNIIGIYSIAAIGLNILTGYTGMISLGHSAIFGMGAYTAVILSSGINAPLWIAIPAGGVISAVIGTGFALPAVRLRGFYICFSTLACQKIMEFIFTHASGLTGGTEGISMSGTKFPGMALMDDMTLYFTVSLLLVLMAWAAVNLMRSRYGRAFQAIRDNQKVAGGMGVPLFRYKLLSFAISSFYAGIAGALFACYSPGISPEDFNLGFSIILIAMIVIGGMGSVKGSIFGAAVIALMREVSIFADRRFADMFNMPFNLSSLYEIAAGILILLFIIFKPKGLAGVWKDISSVFRSWPLTQGINNGFKR